MCVGLNSERSMYVIECTHYYYNLHDSHTLYTYICV